ncbi:uncharacterized protein LOC123226248 [Mangifera indica]|uniref:uncharacterized protein LOC123226248 n=1 Tax=Mangifera indica TaxID=29780 RepID=UPI001CFAC3F0|nr:uncharacterized protein LOC123226248 [Mangifera indica]
MGNAICSCFQQNSMRDSVKLVFWEGDTMILNGKHVAGEILYDSPGKMVCRADSFFIGHPLPALAVDDELMPGQTYFVLPIDRFTCNVLSASTLAAFNSSSSSSSTASRKRVTPMIEFDHHCCPFEYTKGENGRVFIKVVPEFIIRLIQRSKEFDHHEDGSSFPLLCSTPELKKHYDLLVGLRGQVWSPKLEPISEYKIRYSPCRFIGLKWKQQENAC